MCMVSMNKRVGNCFRTVKIVFNRIHKNPNILKNIIKTLILIILTLFVEVAFKASDAGTVLLQAGENYLVSNLADFDTKDFPILIDISEIPMSQSGYGGNSPQVTSRDSLQRIIEKIAEYNPAVIAIDIDFSPEFYINPTGVRQIRQKSRYSDEAFFKFCSNLKNHDNNKIPVFLGVWNNLNGPSSTWLTVDETDSLDQILGASIATIQDFRINAYPLFYRRSDSSSKCLSLAYRMLLAISDTKVQADSIMLNVSAVTEIYKDSIKLKKSGQDSLVSKSKYIINPSDFEQVDLMESISNRAVFMGNTTIGKCTDKFSIAGYDDDITGVCGVFIHAAALMTLQDTNSFNKINIAYIINSIKVLFVILTLFLYFKFSKNPNSKAPTYGFFLNLFMIATYILFGVSLAKYFQYMWIDLFIVIPIMVFGTLLECIIDLHKELPKR